MIRKLPLILSFILVAGVTAVFGRGVSLTTSGTAFPFGGNKALIASPSNNANLSALTTSAGSIIPAFRTSTTAYNITVNNTVTSLTVTPTTADPTASIKVNGATVASAHASAAINLSVGVNTISVVVTAQDGVTTKTYTISVTRVAASNDNLVSLKLSSGTVSPSFAVATTSYTASVSVSSMEVTPVAADVNAKVTVNGSPVTSGSASEPIALVMGANTIQVAVTAANGITNKTYTVVVTRTLSANDNLSALTTSVGTVTPGVTASTTSYSDVVNNATTAVTVKPTTADPTATVTVNGKAVTSGSASGAISLNVGANAVSIVVTAQNGAAKTYALTVTRVAASNDNLTLLKLSSGTLSPAFAVATTSYTASVAVSSLKVTPFVADANAKATVNGAVVASGSASGPIALAVGANTIRVAVTAANGVTTKTYTVVVTRTLSTNDDLSALSASVGAVTPAFLAATTSYSDIVNNTVTSVTVTPVTANAASTVTVNGKAVTSGTASGAISLNVGTNAIPVVVTAENGVATKTYTLTVTRAASGNDNLTYIKISNSALNPTFMASTTSYTAWVANPVASVTITPTAADPGATIKVNGSIVTSGAASAPIALTVGSDNNVSIEVTAANGTTHKTYAIVVTRVSNGTGAFQPVGLALPNDTPAMADDILVVHHGVTPNGDGIDDYLVIDGILAYPDNRLTIMNRNGQLIYEAKGYDNSTKVFDGHSSLNGQMQQPGTYFFALDYTVGGIVKHKTGYLVLKY